jgi:hypothetical protein
MKWKNRRMEQVLSEALVPVEGERWWGKGFRRVNMVQILCHRCVYRKTKKTFKNLVLYVTQVKQFAFVKVSQIKKI